MSVITILLVISQATAGHSGIPLFDITSESNLGIEIHFNVPAFKVAQLEIDGKQVDKFSLASLPGLGDAGAPDLPCFARYIAIPQGARAQVKVMASRTEVYQNVEIAPAPNIPRENDDSPLRYEKDMAIYGRDAYFPESPVLVSDPMQIRGVDVVIMNVTPYQYNPVTKELVVYRDLRVRVDYVGGNGHFGEDRLRSRFWEPVLQGQLLNYGSLAPVDFYAPERVKARDGWEYIIIVPDDPVFIAWADTIKAWRKLQGISCEVFTLTEVGGNTTTAIENFLNNAYNTWEPAPAAFLLLSDYQSSGDLYGITSPVWNGYCVSDNMYADVDGDDLPDMHHGRICVQSGTQLATTVNKLLYYERDPYVAPNFYDEPLIVAAWNSNSWLQLSAEVVRGFFEYGLLKNPAHQYAVQSGSVYPGCPWSNAPNTAGIVQYFYGLGWLADTLNPYDSNYWSNGSAAGINSAINSGAFFVQHRSVAGETAWLYPTYTMTDLYGLTNEMLTFVNSTSSLTGKYNWADECFVEKFHRMNHGALGLNAASEAGYSFVNDVYLWGMMDGMWSEFMPDYPGSRMIGYENLRPCIAMTSGKYYLALPTWPYPPQQRAYVYHLFHHHGDVFMTLYSEMPQYLSVAHDSVFPAGQTYFAVSADDSSVIALTVDGEIIGVALGTGSPVNIDIQPQTAGVVVRVTVTKTNYYRYEEDVQVIQVGVDEGDIDKLQPGPFSVSSITPNPFTYAATIRYGVPVATKTKIAVYDVSGKLMMVLFDGIKQPGWHVVTWNGDDNSHLKASSGIYFCEIKTEDTRIVRKLILLK
jgi:hypothetical protein